MINVKKYILTISGFKQEDIESMNIEDMDNDDVIEHLRKKLINSLSDNGNRQKIVSIDEVETYINRGWEYVDSLSDERKIVRLPF